MNEFRVTDLKQFDYCPRLIFYEYCWERVRPTTAKMELGREAHEVEEGREARRSLKRYGLAEGQEEFRVGVESAALRLRGVVDLVVEAGQEVIPVDYKLSTRSPGQHIKLQLLAYGLMLAEQRGRRCERGFMYSIPKRQATEIKFTPALRQKLTQALETMRHIVEQELMPEPTSERAKCGTCEFRRFCNDV